VSHYGPARFENKVIIITGAASGIGAAAARRFGSEGARLSLADRDFEGLERSSEDLALSDDHLWLAELDVSNARDFTRFVDTTVERFGQLDVLINNAGTGCFGHVTELDDESWRRTMAVDLDSVFYGSRAAIPHLRRTRGCIVNTSSISGLFGDYGLAAYNTAKAGVLNLTRNMAVDHATEGIRVNAICPGGVATPMTRAHTRDEGIMQEYAELVPMGRMAEPEELASAIAFLASDDASYVTGQGLVVDGGVTAVTGQPNFDRLYRSRGWHRQILGDRADRDS
jgi:meso-butanediol dehydrogenase / (S,S)-butanediol dehydrogenase / diacetyl reductase